MQTVIFQFGEVSEFPLLVTRERCVVTRLHPGCIGTSNGFCPARADRLKRFVGQRLESIVMVQTRLFVQVIYNEAKEAIRG